MNVSGPVPPVSPATRPPIAPAAAPRTAEPAATETRPAQAESSLWDLLTPEERDFFTQAATMGPLTYRPGATKNTTNAPLPTGQRIDVRG